VGNYLEPALDTPGIGYAPDFNRVCWQFGGFKSGKHVAGASAAEL